MELAEAPNRETLLADGYHPCYREDFQSPQAFEHFQAVEGRLLANGKDIQVTFEGNSGILWEKN